MALLLYRVNSRARHQRQIQDHIETIHAILGKMKKHQLPWIAADCIYIFKVNPSFASFSEHDSAAEHNNDGVTHIKLIHYTGRQANVFTLRAL